MLNVVKHLTGGKVGVSTLEQILRYAQNGSRSGFSMIAVYKPRIAAAGSGQILYTFKFI